MRAIMVGDAADGVWNTVPVFDVRIWPFSVFDLSSPWGESPTLFLLHLLLDTGCD